MLAHRRRTSAAAVGIAAAVLGLSAVVLLGGLGSADFQRAFTDVVQFGVALLATGTALVAARSSAGRTRATWAAIAVACGSWASGQLIWCWYEIGRHVQTPFPSLADVGFLAFPVAAAVALVLHPARGASAARSRRLLDALVATSALALVTWETALGAVLRTGGADGFALAVSLAYPLGDLLLLVFLVLTIGQTSGSRRQLALLAAGLAALAISDSGFAYLTSTGSFDGGAVTLGWIAGFLLLALAPIIGSAADEPLADGAPVVELPMVLPYVAVGVACAVTVGRVTMGDRPSTWQNALVGLIVLLVLARQYLTLRENSTLVGELAVREAQLRHQAFHDALTGLANRALFQDRLAHALELHARDLRAVSVLFLDLDDFKLINDTLGHAAGDELLMRVSERLRAAVRTGDTVARVGGDEFAVLLEDGGDPVTVAAAVEASLQSPFTLNGTMVKAGASIGVVAVEAADAATTADDLLARADTAMYTAKRSGKGQLRLYQQGMSLSELSDHRMGSALAAAVASQELTLVYQPVVNLDNGRVEGVEALSRWRHQGRIIPPSEFIPVAERTGVINPLTEWVLDEACERLAEWSRALKQLPHVAVNVSPGQINDPDFVDTVVDAVSRHHLRRGQLVLEITESALLTDVVIARQVLSELRDAGVRIALDDFGVGYSSLSQLHAIELDVVKIDRSFIERLDTDPRQARFLRSLLRMGDDLGLSVIGEGVERQTQLDLLHDLGCRLVQGYLLARPMYAADVPLAMSRRRVPVRF